MSAISMPLKGARCLGIGLLVPLLVSVCIDRGVCQESGMSAVITIAEDASSLESLAATEVIRYVYLRTGKLLGVQKGVGSGDRIVVASKNRELCGDLGQHLGPQQFLLKTGTANGESITWIVGGDPLGTLYGAYRFAEKLGVRFGLDEDIIPDAPLTGGLPHLNEAGKPRFALRGLQPFHDFSVGPDWWNLEDYRSVLSQMAKLRMNFLGLHTYPSWNPATGPEANVWIGLPEDVDDEGNVRFGYEAGVVTTQRGWAVTPFPTSRYAAGAGLLFENDAYGPDFMLDCLEWPKTEEACTAMFNRYGDFQKDAFESARRLGIKTCVGTEMPLGVPDALASRLEAQGMRPDEPAVIRRLYEGTFQRLMRKMPVDYYWLWTPEVWLGMEPGCKGWEMTTRENVERDLGLAEAATKALDVPFGLATCGWRLGTRKDGLWMHKRTPLNWPASSINTQLGRDPVEKYYGEMPGRPKWAIAWGEDDGTAGAHCCTCWDLQLWAERMFRNASEAFQYGCEGMMAIHWRTAAISPNIMALSQAGWEFHRAGNPNAGADAFWADWGRALFGGDAGAQAGRIMQQFDGSHLRINALIQGGANTGDKTIAKVFRPLEAMESLRPSIQGVGNLERFDYWLNLVEATRLRVRTWILAERLNAKMQKLKRIQAPNKAQTRLREEILPLRLAIARTYENLIAAYVHSAKSPGDIGTIASIESGSRQRILSAHDAAIAEMLGEPLPPEASVSTVYRGAPRIFVSSKSSHQNAGEPQELRPFVLSGPKCTGVKLFWRPLGKGAFQKVAATHRKRQAYRVKLPAQREGAVEYYLEATLRNGRQVRWPATAPALNSTTVFW